MKRIAESIHRQRHWLLWPLAAIGLLVAVIWLVGLLTGRAQFQPNDPSASVDVLVDVCLRVVPCILAITFVVIVKRHADANRAFDGVTGTFAYFVSRAQTVALLWLFLNALTH